MIEYFAGKGKVKHKKRPLNCFKRWLFNFNVYQYVIYKHGCKVLNIFLKGDNCFYHDKYSTFCKEY